MDFPVGHFIDNINHKKIYYFFSNQLVNTTDPHYFVCIGFDSDNVIILSCFTSQIEKQKEYIVSRDLDFSTLVHIDPTTENGLTQSCVVNCNNKLFLHTKEEFKNLYELGKISFKGELEDIYYSQIFTGIQNSDLIEEETKLKVLNFE